MQQNSHCPKCQNVLQFHYQQEKWMCLRCGFQAAPQVQTAKPAQTKSAVPWKTLTGFLAIGLLLASLVAVAMLRRSPSAAVTAPPSSAPALDRSKFDTSFNSKLGKLQKKWASVSVTKWDDKMITLHLNYSQMPGSLTEVEADTTKIAQQALNSVIEQGYSPRQEWLAVFVHAQMSERGATGASMVRRFGKASYNFNTDSIEFSKAGSFY